MRLKRLLIQLSVLLCFLLMFSCGLKNEEKNNEEETSKQQEKSGKEDIKKEVSGIEKVLGGLFAKEPTAPKVDYKRFSENYKDTLEAYYRMLYLKDDDGDVIEDSMGVLEPVFGLRSDEALDKIGFALVDVSEDGVPELLIGSIEDTKGEKHYASNILALYTYSENAAQFVFGGSARDMYFLTEDSKTVFNSGSAGAMYSLFGVFELSDDGTVLSCRDCYFSQEKDETYSDIGYYHSTKGYLDKSEADELQGGSEEFENIRKKLEGKKISYELIPFSQSPFIPSQDTLVSGNIDNPVSVFYAEQIMNDYSDFDEFIADNNEYRAKLVFTTDTKVRDFRVLAVSYEGTNENDEILYQKEEIYKQDDLIPERPLIVYMTFFGSMPSYGISYLDDMGKTRTFIVYQSGLDGSVLLQEIFNG